MLVHLDPKISFGGEKKRKAVRRENRIRKSWEHLGSDHTTRRCTESAKRRIQTTILWKHLFKGLGRLRNVPRKKGRVPCRWGEVSLLGSIRRQIPVIKWSNKLYDHRNLAMGTLQIVSDSHLRTRASAGNDPGIKRRVLPTEKRALKHQIEGEVFELKPSCINNGRKEHRHNSLPSRKKETA